MESAHLCEFWRRGAPPGGQRDRAREGHSLAPFLQQLLQINVGLLALLTVLTIYGLPTALELAAGHALNPWLAVILPGDMMGCAVLAGVLQKPRTGVLLYLALTAVEGLSYAAHGLGAHDLVWLADVIPTLVVLTLLFRMKLRVRRIAVL